MKKPNHDVEWDASLQHHCLFSHSGDTLSTKLAGGGGGSIAVHASAGLLLQNLLQYTCTCGVSDIIMCDSAHIWCLVNNIVHIKVIKVHET